MASVLDMPYALPNSCGICGYGGSNREWYMDTEKQFEFFGAFYICNLCFGYLAGLVDYMSPDQARELGLENQALVTSNEALTERIDLLTSAIKSLEKADIHVVTSPVIDISPDPIDESDVPVLQDSDEGVSDSRTGESDLESGEGETSEPSDDEGVAELRTDATNDFSFSFES